MKYFPSGDFLYDSDGVRYSYKKSTEVANLLTLKIRLDEVIERNLDEDYDTNPMDILFSPDSEYNELIVNYRKDKPMAKQNKIIITSKDVNSKTITIKAPRYFKLKTTDRLSLRPNLFYIERQLEMLQILRDYPLPHHDALLKLTEQGTDDSRNKLWQSFDSLEELQWKILTRDTDGTEQQRDFVRKAVSTPDFAILQYPPDLVKPQRLLNSSPNLLHKTRKSSYVVQLKPQSTMSYFE